VHVDSLNVFINGNLKKDYQMAHHRIMPSTTRSRKSYIEVHANQMHAPKYVTCTDGLPLRML